MSAKKTYSDGNIELELLSIFKDTPLKDRQEKINSVLSNNPSWPLIYHLSPKRENLLNWIEFNKDAKVLEIGAGCGALTQLLANQTKKVVALELSSRRTAINKARNSHLKNIEFITGNLSDYSSAEKFDFVTSIGVLEYSGMFIDVDHNPYIKFLKQAKKLLKPKGQLILAIENRFGIKYLSGAREDHSGRFFDNIEDYPSGIKVKTFGKKELSELLNEAGFTKLNFYFPVPDYKMPMIVHNESFLNKDFYYPYTIFPTPSPDQPRVQLFYEQLAIKQFINNGLYPDIANSFLVFAERGRQ